ncbi:MAG: PAS domain S-box protein [Myxococcales bacterium]|nr:PAS domain S-box protein [Myxococcales bacterium]
MAQGDTGSPTEPTSASSKASTSSKNDDAIWQTEIARLLERFLPDSLRSSSPEERSQARVLTGMLLVMLGGSVLVVAGQVVNGTAFGLKLGLAIAGGWTAFLIAIRAGVRIRTLSQGVLGYIYLVSVGVTFASGGEATFAVLIACLLPIFAFILEGAGRATRWTIAVLAGVGLTALYASTTDTNLFGGEILPWNQMRFASITAMVSFVYLVALTIERVVGIASKEAQESKAQLATQNAHYRLLIENMGDLLMEYDDKSSCLYTSPNSLEIIGRSDHDLLGDQYVEHIHPDDLRDIRAALPRLLERPGVTQCRKVRIRHAGGHWVHGQVTARSFKTQLGKTHCVTIFRDVSELRRAELTVRHAERLSSAGTLAAGVAHQINNPVGSIRLASELALRCAKEGDWRAVETLLEENVDQATRCCEIIKSLLQFAAHESTIKVTQDLVEIIERARHFTISYARERGIEIDIVGDRGPLWVNVCAIEIEQVLVNLTRNAIESRPVSQRVEIVVSRIGDVARVEVRDDGCGIAESDRAQVFDPFFTTRMNEGGSGLGLSVVHGIVRDHGGVIELESAEGKGTCGRMELPLVDEVLDGASLD